VSQIAASRGWYYDGTTTYYTMEHVCAVKSDGTAWCWGYNGQGQLGDNTSTQRPNPVQVKTGASTYLAGVTRIATGPMHSCAIAGGNAYCWGYGANDWNGTNATANSLVAIQVHGLKNVGTLGSVSKIAVSGYSPYGFVSVVTSSGTLYSWGYNG